MKMSSHSSTSSSSSSTTSLSTDSQTSASSSTSLDEAQQHQPLNNKNKKHPQMHTPDRSHGDQTDSNHGGLVTSVAHVKRYMNSPFGLNRHYLTMPDEPRLHVDTALPSRKNKTLAPADDPEDYESDTLSSSSNNKRRPTADKQLSCDLSVIAGDSSSPGSPADRWLDYKRHKSIHPPHSKPASKHHRKSKPVSPAGDAGLDATRCNAKDGSRKCSLDCVSTDDQGDLIKPAWQGVPTSGQIIKSACESSSLLVRFSSIMYATFLVILGCILHVSELRQKSKNSSDHIYTTIVALVGIGWLLFLQTDLQRYKRYASKYILIESIFNDRKPVRNESERNFRQIMNPGSRSTTSSSASLVNDRMSLNTEVIFKKTAYTMYQQRAALERNRSNNSHLPVGPKADARYAGIGGSSMSLFSGKQSPPPLNSQTSDQNDILIPAYKFLHGKMGANFYLKCGMAAFCFGHVIHEGLRFGQQVYFFGAGNAHCRDSAAMIAHLVTPLYSFYQLFMMFKYSNVSTLSDIC